MSLDEYNLFVDFGLDVPSVDLGSEPFVMSSPAFEVASGSPAWSFNNNHGFQTTNSGSEFNVTFTGTNFKHSVNVKLTTVQESVSGGMDTT